MQGLLLPFIFTVTVAYIGDEAEGSAGIRLVGDYALGTIFGGFAGQFLTGYAAAFAGWRFSFLFLAALRSPPRPSWCNGCCLRNASSARFAACATRLRVSPII